MRGYSCRGGRWSGCLALSTTEHPAEETSSVRVARFDILFERHELDERLRECRVERVVFRFVRRVSSRLAIVVERSPEFVAVHGHAALPWRPFRACKRAVEPVPESLVVAPFRSVAELRENGVP